MQKGFKHTLETKKRLSISARNRDNTNRIASLPRGSKHWRYTKNPSVLTLHKRIHRQHGSAKLRSCRCGERAMDWAFIGKGEYSDNIIDYTPLCRKCHIALDKHHTKRDPSCYFRNKDEKGRFTKHNTNPWSTPH